MKKYTAIAVVAFLFFVWWSWFHRFTTNTAAGRFYKNDRWTGRTLVVEKNGDVHWLRK